MVSHWNAVTAVAAALGGLVWHAPTAAAAEAAAPTIEFRPYRVLVQLAPDAAQPPEPQELGRVSAELRQLAERLIGPRWELEVRTARSADWASPQRLEAWTADDAQAAAAELPAVDAAYFAILVAEPNQRRVVVRRWEPLFRDLSPVAAESCFDPRDLELQLLRALHRLFRPRAHWQPSGEQHVHVRVQAAALGEPDPALPLLVEQEVFTPWLILRRRDGQIARLQELPFTQLVLWELEDGRGLAAAASGLRNPLAAKPRSRTEFVAVAARPLWSQTRLTVVAQTQPPRPLAAHRVELAAFQLPAATAAPENAAGPPADEESAAPPQTRYTSRVGTLDLARAPETPLLWATVYSGTLKLARVPILPGAVPQLRLELPDDALRLRVEGQLEMLQGELVGTVAQHATARSAVRAALKQPDWKAVDALLEAADKLPKAAGYLERVNAIRVAAVAEARARKDRVTEQRIVRLCRDADELVRRYLDPQKLQLLHEEVDELKKSLRDEEAALRRAAEAPAEPPPKQPAAPARAAEPPVPPPQKPAAPGF